MKLGRNKREKMDGDLKQTVDKIHRPTFPPNGPRIVSYDKGKIDTSM